MMSYAQQQHGGSNHNGNQQQLHGQVTSYDVQFNNTDSDDNSKPQIIRQEDQALATDISTMEQDIPEATQATNDSMVNNDQSNYIGNGPNESGISVVQDRLDKSGNPSGAAASNEDDDDDDDIAAHASFVIKPDGKSYKYPQLKNYYEFGPWVGRNRKAICKRCKHQSASSQPERLIKHMKKCIKLTEDDKCLADELLIETHANKKTNKSRSTAEGDDSEYYADDDLNNSSVIGDQSVNKKPKLVFQPKRGKTNDRKANIDQALTKFIMCCSIPLKSIHSKEFVEFVRSLDPDYRLPSRETITNVLIPGLLNIL